MALPELLKCLRGLLPYGLLRTLRSLAEQRKRSCNIPCIGEQGTQVQQGAAEFWPQPDGLTILFERGSNLALCGEKISQQVMCFRSRWIAPQELFYLALRVVKTAGAR